PAESCGESPSSRISCCPAGMTRMRRFKGEAQASSCVIVLPTRRFGGHEKMLLEWLVKAVARGLSVEIFCADNERLIHGCVSSGLARPVVSHPPKANAVRDAFITWRLLSRFPRNIPVLFAPGVVQA